MGRKKKEETSEDYCFICKDGGLLIVCDHAHCIKSYHPECVGKNKTLLAKKKRWICRWHTCFICHKRSKYQCFCCPNSVCKACINDAEFVCLEKNKGFCIDCLKLVLMVEENLDVDSDGGKADFKDRDTYECLFKEYWEIINQEERLSLDELREASALLKRGENNAEAFSSDEMDLLSDVDDVDDIDNDGMLSLEASKGQKAMWKRYRAKKKKFIGWGTKELINFLKSIGKSTDEPISQSEVYDIVKDYIQENKLLHPQRNKKVICDARLRSLFRRKSVNRLKISELLEGHFLENQVQEDESSHGSEDENFSVVRKRSRRLRSCSKTHRAVPNNFVEEVLEVPKNLYAAVTTKNVKLVYLRRTLIEEFVKTPEMFDSKVMDCFVRVKCDPKDRCMSRSFFQLMQVTGVKRDSETYRIEEITTNIFLLVSNMMKAIRICMLSDDDFTEEECEDLHQRVKEGLIKRPTIAELDEKARSLHEDITNHWVDREIVLLQKLIDRANEKGWRRELFEYIEKRELLQTPAERLRLLKELPKVIADAEIELDTIPHSPEDPERLQGTRARSRQKAEKGETKGNQATSDEKGNHIASSEKPVESEAKGCADVINEKAAEGEDEGIAARSIVARQHEIEEEQQYSTAIEQCEEKNGHCHLADNKKSDAAEKPIIKLNEDKDSSDITGPTGSENA